MQDPHSEEADPNCKHRAETTLNGARPKLWSLSINSLSQTLPCIGTACDMRQSQETSSVYPLCTFIVVGNSFSLDECKIAKLGLSYSLARARFESLSNPMQHVRGVARSKQMKVYKCQGKALHFCGTAIGPQLPAIFAICPSEQATSTQSARAQVLDRQGYSCMNFEKLVCATASCIVESAQRSTRIACTFPNKTWLPRISNIPPQHDFYHPRYRLTFGNPQEGHPCIPLNPKP